jgi:hypothetical protein
MSTCKAFLHGRPGYYVYLLRRPDGRPFYVGKGFGDRVFQHENEARHPNGWRSNAHKLNVIRSIWRDGSSVTYEIDLHVTDEAHALRREMQLIGMIKRLHEGGPLTNRDPGGGSIRGRAPASAERHSATLGGIPIDNPGRAVLNRFVLSIGQMKSVVLKPTDQFKPKPSLRYPDKTIGPSFRQAVALAASAASNGVSLDGACQIPRKVVVDGVSGFVENGVSCDVLSSGMAAVVSSLGRDPSEEIFELTATQARIVAGYLGLRKCVDLGILSAHALEQGRKFFPRLGDSPSMQPVGRISGA